MAAFVVYTTDTSTVWQFSPVTDSNSAIPGTPISLTGATGAQLRFAPQSGAPYTGAGSVTISASTVDYVPAPADLKPSTRCEVQLSIEYGSATRPMQPVVFQIIEAL